MHGFQHFAKAVMLCLLVGLVSGCSSSPSYQAVDSQGFGYSEVRLNTTDYRVVYQQRGFSNQKAKQGALRRAAELAQADGHEWFVVLHEHVDRHETTKISSTTVVDRRCGLLGCQSVATSTPVLDSPSSDRVTVTLTVRVGHGVRPAQNVFEVDTILAPVNP